MVMCYLAELNIWLSIFIYVSQVKVVVIKIELSLATAFVAKLGVQLLHFEHIVFLFNIPFKFKVGLWTGE